MRWRAVAICCLLVGVVSSCDRSSRSLDGGDVTDAKPSFERHDVACAELDRFVQRVRRGYVPVRSPDITLIPHEPNQIGPPDAAVHAGPYDYLAEVPLVLYGKGHVEPIGTVDEAPTMADVAPTIARLIGFSRFAAPDGRALTTGLPASGTPPRLVVTVVWDGGGWNTLREHPRSWPFLKRMIDRGVSFGGMEIGSTPSVTPPIHTTLGTGAFPRTHGIPHVKMMTAAGDYVDPMEMNSPRYIRIPALADVYDRALRNRPVVGVVATVNWHLGMIGRGRLHPGGDSDLAALFTSSGTTFGDPDLYEIPSDLADPEGLVADAEALDAADGATDGMWRGHPLDDPALRYAGPAYVRWFGDALRSVIDTRGFGDDRVPDLVFANFKSLDDSVHKWGLTSRETREVLAATDAELKALVEHLEDTVGTGSWVVIVTADHGTSKFVADSGGWAVHGHELRVDLNRAFDVDEEPLFERVNSAGIYLNDGAVARSRLDLAEVGEWLLDYTAIDNLYKMDEVPAYYEDKAEVPLFDAVMFGDRVVARSCRNTASLD
ncbi:MAG: alkaline phosphatase family protein [Actinobacteria bacterium]|nr:alkaline phosphatase family protein [Actinomycetota bacterium]